MEKLYTFSGHILIVLKKRALLFLFASTFFITCYSQTTNISGVINSYYKVVDIVPAKACALLGDVTGLTINSKVMIIQMKGASIVTMNNSSFGDTSGLNNAGNYEIATICDIRMDSVFFFHNFLRTYTPLTNHVQLVKFAEYYSANVTDTVKAAFWNNATGTGGVIALYVDQDLTLNAPIWADSTGYKGGSFLLHGGNCTDGLPANGYAYNGNSTGSFLTGAFKGEGVADVITTQSGGRGAPANGGGGGNNHNNSGGGGANLGAGGRGGGNSSNSVPCTLPFQGEAGKALSSWGGKKIFMGGGGGAGNSNGGLFIKGGGNGGGIIFIWIGNNLIGNNKLITANGALGGPSQSDGAGGGGAGGTIILHVSNYSGVLTVRANGGNGGTSNDAGNSNRCFGGGGDGSGGVIYFTGSLPAITAMANAGAAGPELSRDVAGCLPTPVASLPGTVGQIVSSYNFSASTTPSGSCSLILPTGLMSFKANADERRVVLRWRVLNPDQVAHFTIERKNAENEWVSIHSVEGKIGQEEYTSTDNAPFAGYNLYRLKITEKDNSVSYSDIRRVFVDYSGNTFNVYPNPATNKITISGKLTVPVEMKLVDLSGRVVLQKKLFTDLSEVALPSIAKGIYMLHIDQTVIKLVVQ